MTDERKAIDTRGALCPAPLIPFQEGFSGFFSFVLSLVFFQGVYEKTTQIAAR